MKTSHRPAFLRLVHSADTEKYAPLELPEEGSAQGLFFPSSRANTLVFMDWNKTSLADLQDVLDFSKPKAVFDLRVIPRFDLETLTRRAFFDVLANINCQYIDVLGRANIADVRAADVNPRLIARLVGDLASNLQDPRQGPLVFIHDDDIFDDEYIHNFANALPAPGSPWQVFSPTAKLGSNKTPAGTNQSPINTPSFGRNVVFVSHATPEDNDFVMWLTAKLTLAGYEVWSDIARLQGGDSFWADIENVIRNKAAKVVFVHSKYSKEKSGTRKEVYLSLRIGESLKADRFVIPLRIDNSAFHDTFIELVNLQAIDCRADWLNGLNSLLALLQRDGVPRRTTPEVYQYADLITKAGNPSYVLTKEAETLTSSWLKVMQPPSQIHFYNCNGLLPNEVPDIADKLGVPAFGYFALLGSTASLDHLTAELKELGKGYVHLTHRASIPWADFMAGEWSDLPRASVANARRHATLVLNRAIAIFMERKGCCVGTLSNDRPFWFFPSEFLPKNEIKFRNHSGLPVRRQLVGFSKKRRVFWHFGIQPRTTILGGEPVVQLSSHVTFTADGRNILDSAAHLHSLRRSFCRSWWNNRWRDLLQGYVSALSSDSGQLIIETGDVIPYVICDRFMQFTAPRTPVPTTEILSPSVSLEDEVEDEWEDEGVNDMDDVDNWSRNDPPDGESAS